MAKQKVNDDFLQILKTRLGLAERFSGRRNENVKKWIKDYKLETILEAGIEGLSNKIQIPYIFSTVESGLPTIFERMPQIIMTQRGKMDREFTNFASKIWDYLVSKLGLEEEIENIGTNFKLLGMGVAKYGWEVKKRNTIVEEQVPINETESQTIQKMYPVPIKNQPFVKEMKYNSIYFSPESVFKMDDEDNEIPYIICRYVKTKEAVEQEYGIKVDDDELEMLNLSEIDPDLASEDLAKEFRESDLKRIVLYEYYGLLPQEFAGKDWEADQNYYLVFNKHRIYKQPEPIDKKPFLLLGNYGLSTDFWKFGDAKVLRELEHDISLGRSRMMDIRDKYGTKIAIPEGTTVDEAALKRPADFTIMRFSGNQMPVYVTPPPIPEAIMIATDQSRSDIQMAAAQLDISRGGIQSAVKTATGQTIYAQAAEKRLNRQKKKIAMFIKALARNLLSLCGENWDEEELSKITDIPLDEIKQAGFLEKMKNIGTLYDISIDIESVTMNRETMAAQAIALYREVKDDPSIKHEEVLKDALKIGFNIIDTDRYLAGEMTPEQLMTAVQQLIQMGILPPEFINTLIQALQGMGQPQLSKGEEGRPMIQNPVEVMKKSMPGANNLQISAQNRAAYKQTGVPKGPQNI